MDRSRAENVWPKPDCSRGWVCKVLGFGWLGAFSFPKAGELDCARGADANLVDEKPVLRETPLPMSSVMLGSFCLLPSLVEHGIVPLSFKAIVFIRASTGLLLRNLN